MAETEKEAGAPDEPVTQDQAEARELTMEELLFLPQNTTEDDSLP